MSKTVELPRAVVRELIRSAKYAAQQVQRERAVFTFVTTTTDGSAGRKNAEVAFKQKREFTDVAVTDMLVAIRDLEQSLETQPALVAAEA